LQHASKEGWDIVCPNKYNISKPWRKTPVSGCHALNGNERLNDASARLGHPVSKLGENRDDVGDA